MKTPPVPIAASSVRNVGPGIRRHCTGVASMGVVMMCSGMPDEALDALELPLFPWHTSAKPHIVRVEPELQELGLDASLIQVAGSNDVVVTAFFEVNLGNRLGAMSVCLPYTVLEQVASKLSAQVWLTAGQANNADPRTRRAVRTILGWYREGADVERLASRPRQPIA